MSTSKGSVVVQLVPASAKKMVESLKEVVNNYSESEIYLTLKDCDMNPDEAVTRLLSQDTFHEVKSKREKKKEVKDGNEYKPRGTNSSSTRSGRSVVEPYLGNGGSTPYYSSESVLNQGKYEYGKKTEAASYASSLSSVPSISGYNINNGTTGFSDSDHTSAENIGPSLVGGSGQLSMADIVKMGRPRNKVATAHDGFHNNECSSRFPDTNISQVQDEWPSTENPVASVVESVPEITFDSHVPSEDLAVHINSEYQDYEANKDEETGKNEGFMGFHATSRAFPDDDSRRGSQYGKDLRSNTVDKGGAFVSLLTRHEQQLSVESNERGLPSEGKAEAPLTVQFPDHLRVNAADLLHLSFGNFHAGMSIPSSSGSVRSLPVETSLEERHSGVKIPSVSHPDYRELEYYGGGSLRNATYGTSINRTRFSDESSAPQLKPPNGVIDYRLQSSIHDYSDDDLRLLNAAIIKLNFQMQNQLQQPEKHELHEHHIPSSVPDNSVGNMLPNNLPWYESPGLYSNPTLYSSPMNMKTHNQAPQNDELQSYLSSSLPTLLGAQYGVPASAIGGSMVSMSEALKIPGLQSMQPAPHNLSGPIGLTGAPPLQQQLALDSYSQPNRHSDPYDSAFGGHPSWPQSSACMPSGFQQNMANNSPYHQSLAAAPPVKCEINSSAVNVPPFKSETNPSAVNVPPFKREVNPSAVHVPPFKCEINPSAVNVPPSKYEINSSAVNVPNSADRASRYRYGGPVSEDAVSGNFSMPRNSSLHGNYLNYDDLVSAQHKDRLLQSRQQNENSLMWPQGPVSRTIPAVPSSTCSDYLGQGQQPARFGQSQQTSSSYGLQGYQNYYYSNQIPGYGSQDCSHQGQLRQY